MTQKKNIKVSDRAKKLLDDYKLIPDETYDSEIIRILGEKK